MYRLRGEAAAEGRRLLRVLLLRLGTLSADPGRACGRTGSGFLLCGLSRGQHFRAILTRLAWQCPHNMLAWWVPDAAMAAAPFLRVPVRAVVWIVYSHTPAATSGLSLHRGRADCVGPSSQRDRSPCRIARALAAAGSGLDPGNGCRRARRHVPAISEIREGDNRISAGTLYQLSLTLEVPVGYFFEGWSGHRKKPR